MNTTELIFFLLIALLVTALSLFALGHMIQYANLKIQPMVEVSLDKKVIFKGSKACISTKTDGPNTNIEIFGGFLCLFPQEIYSSKNIEITTVLTVP
jgi:hypothetical protein